MVACMSVKYTFEAIFLNLFICEYLNLGRVFQGKIPGALWGVLLLETAYCRIINNSIQKSTKL